jgi:GR25 family glycosyltransferase involved in LPS biosynthesis
MRIFNRPLFVISIDDLARTPLETKILIEKFQNTGDFFLIGVDGTKIKSNDDLSNDSRKFLEFIVGGVVSTGELGCLLSHQKVYESMLSREIDSAIVLEDDACLNLEIEELEEIILECEKSAYEMVNFYSPKGGVIRRFDNQLIGSNMVPGLFACSYWINLSGARKLKSNDYYYVLADWPVTISKVNMGTLIKPAFSHSAEKFSIISTSLSENAKHRQPIIFRNLKSVLKINNVPYLLKIVNEINLVNTFKLMFTYRIIRRFYRLKYSKTKGLNETIIVK